MVTLGQALTSPNKRRMPMFLQFFIDVSCLAEALLEDGENEENSPTSKPATPAMTARPTATPIQYVIWFL